MKRMVKAYQLSKKGWNPTTLAFSLAEGMTPTDIGGIEESSGKSGKKGGEKEKA